MTQADTTQTGGTSKQADQTAAAALAANPAVDDAIERIVGEIESARASITGVRGPVTGGRESLKDFLERQKQNKGRGGFFPYIGSGIGNGPLVELLDGSVKWDLINGIGVHMFGHSDPDLIRTGLRAAMGDTVQQGNLQCNADAVMFGETLVEQASRGSALRHCFLTNSGAMANESALKICQQKSNAAPRVIAFRDCFMGRSTAMSQIGDNAGGRIGLPLNVQVDYMPFFDADDPEGSIEAACERLDEYISRYPGQHACFVMELVQGEGGFKTAPREFFEPLMGMCRENGIAVWADEVQSFGRTTEMFCFQTLGLGEFIDVVTIGKMSQVCATLFTEAMNPKPGLLSGTFLGDTVGLQVGRRIVDRLRDGGYYGPDGRIAQLHDAFVSRARKLAKSHPEWFPAVPGSGGEPFGGIGGMMRMTPFGGDRTKINTVVQTLYRHGVISFFCGHGPYHVRFLPPIGVMEPEQFDDVFLLVEAALEQVAEKSDD